MEAKLVEAQAAIPLAMAEAFRSGRLGIMDYQRIHNIQADTDMRTALSKLQMTEVLNCKGECCVRTRMVWLFYQLDSLVFLFFNQRRTAQNRTLKRIR